MVDSVQLGRELSGLLNAKLPVLRSLGFPGSTVIEPETGAASGWRLKGRSPDPVTAWRLPCEGSKVTWLGTDGNAYSAYVDQFGDVPYGWSVAGLAGLDAPVLETAIVSLKRLLRFHAPEHALPERIHVFGTVFTAMPRVATPWDVPLEKLQRKWERDQRIAPEITLGIRKDPSFSPFHFSQDTMVPALNYHQHVPPAFIQAREEEERREAADDEADPAARWHEGPAPSRPEQVRYLFVSWLHRITALDWLAPAEFFRAAGPLTRYGQRSQPNVPFAPGGPVRPSEIAALIEPLIAEGLAEWVDDYCAGRDAYCPKLLLTETGLRYATGLQSRFAAPEHMRELRTAMLTWAGHHAKPPYLVTLEQFVTSLSSVVNGIATTETDARRTARWLIRRGYLHRDDFSLEIGLTSQGVQCLEHYKGDPYAMGGAQHRGDDHRTFNLIGPTGNVAIDSGHFTQQSGSVVEHPEVDVAALRRFAEAVAQALPVLGLGDGEQAADAFTTEIMQASAESHPDHPKLRALGRSLRTILEGAAGNALASGLLNLWIG